MTNVTFNRKEFETALGSKITKEIEEKISLFGTPLERLDENEVEVEIFPNRPDLISIQGYLRSFRAFIGKETGLKKYKVSPPEKNYKVKIDPSVKSVRPFTACAIIKNLKFDEEKIKSIIDLQEKLHFTVGRNRKKLAIGVYPLEKITLPITYTALDPKKIKFIPLEETSEMDGLQILSRTQTGRDYSHLLEGKEKFPVFLDAKNKVLSMPPIINSHETGKVTFDTKDVFVECSGFNQEILQKTLNIIVTTLAEMGGKVYQMELISGSNKTITPDLSPEKMKISVEKANKLLGLNLKEKDLEKLLPKMGHDYKNKTVYTPAWRTDVLHEVDIIEDIAIAYGYNNFTPEFPNISTIGEESTQSKIKSKIEELLIGLGLIEISSYHLIKKEEAERAKLREQIELENSKTEYKFLRPNLLIPALRILSENKDNEYPQEIFEIGTVFSSDKTKKSDTGVIETENLCITSTPSNFTRIKQILDYLTKNLNLSYELEEVVNDTLIEGRTASIKINNKVVGQLGEVHPETLREWNLKMPVAILEISLDQIF